MILVVSLIQTILSLAHRYGNMLNQTVHTLSQLILDSPLYLLHMKQINLIVTPKTLCKLMLHQIWHNLRLLLLQKRNNMSNQVLENSWIYLPVARLLIVLGFLSRSEIILVRQLGIRLDLLQIVCTKSLVLIFSKPMHPLFNLKLSVSSLPLLPAINYRYMVWML